MKKFVHHRGFQAGVLGLLIVTCVAGKVFAQEKTNGTLELVRPNISKNLLSVSKIKPVTAVIQKPLKAQKAEVAEKRDASDFKWSGEELYYSVKVNGVEAVRSAVKVGEVRYKGDKPYVPIVGSAQSVGFFHAIYPMRDTANTFVSPETLRPLRSEKRFHENGKKRSYVVDFAHTIYRAKVKKVKFASVEGKKDHKRKFARSIPGTTHDMLTWFFDLRKSGKMKVGDTLEYYIYDGWKLSRIQGEVVGKEDVYTPIGWFKTFRIDFTREVLRSKSKKGQPPTLKVSTPAKPTGSLYISRDENLIPVAVKINTKWGSAETVLMKYKLPTAAMKKSKK